MDGLHVHPSLKEVKKVTKHSVFLTFLETRFQDGRSGLQGVSKGCQRGVPGDPNVAPAVPNVAHGVPDVAKMVSTKWRIDPKGCPM